MSTDTTIEITQVTCESTSEAGHDEVYIQYSIDNGKYKRYPDSGYTSMAPGDTWDADLVITFKTSVSVQLYDNDSPGHDDLLGSHTYTASDPQPETVTVSNTNGAEYQISST